MHKESRTVAFLTLGCKVNQYETDGMAQLLEKAGYRVVTLEEGADVTIVNTCAVTNIAERKSRQMMRRAKEKNKNTVLVAAGCYIQNVENTLEELPEVDLFLGNNQKNHIVAFLEEYFHNQQRCNHRIDVNHTSEYEEFSIGATREHTRAYVKIQDGCNQFCSYCIIPYVRGRVRSRELEDIIKEVEQLAVEGYREIVLTGIHISSYGVDWKEREITLLTLLQRLQLVDGIERIRLGSLEPSVITEEFVTGIAGLPKICPHFHLSLQSGCDATLKRMNRHYTTAQYRKKCELLRQQYGNPALTTDVIVGFPGETEEEFEATCAFLEKLNLYEMHVFKYSIREGTNAAKMPAQVDGNEKHKRSERLLAMTRQQKKRFEEEFIGTEEEILIEEEKQIGGNLYYVGHTRHYLNVAVPKELFEESEKPFGKCFLGKIDGHLEEGWLNISQIRLGEEFS